MSAGADGALSIRERIRVAASSLPMEAGEAVRRETERLAQYLGLVLEANARMNLVSARTAQPEILVERHLIDSLLGLPLLPSAETKTFNVLDIGTGGGFPAIPLLIVRADLRGTLVESTGKKCRFLVEVVRALSLTAEIVNARFPDSYPMKPPARFDLLTSRAVADGARLVRQARPLLKPGARALLWTTEALCGELTRTGACGMTFFFRAPGAERRGIAVLERFT
jgi:16S rRNA (guanine527-N7)-methyltransferase